MVTGFGGGSTSAGRPPATRRSSFRRASPGAFRPAAELIFQMHYTPNGKATTDRSKVGFVLYKGKDKPQHFSQTQPVMNMRIHIPAGDPNYKVESAYKFPRDAKIYQLHAAHAPARQGLLVRADASRRPDAGAAVGAAVRLQLAEHLSPERAG